MSDGIHRPSTTFRDLALALSEDERRSLHKRVSTSLNLKAQPPERPFHSPSGDRDRAELIAREMAGMTFWQRLALFFRRLISTRSDEQTYVEFRLAGLRRRAKSVCQELSPLEFHTVGRAIADRAWPLYQAAYPVIPLFLDFWKGGNYLQNAVEYLLAQRIPAARSDLFEFATLEELQEAFFANELKGDVRKLVVQRLDAYLAEIPEELFKHLEEGLVPFYYLRQICLFDFNSFFRVFGFDPGIAPPEDVPPFRESPTSAALPFVERLYYCLHSAAKLDPDFYFHTEILDRYLEQKDREHEGGVDDPSEAVAEQAYQDRRSHVRSMRDEIHTLHAAALKLLKGVPFADVIRYYTKDPWLRISAFLPELRLREFYRSYLMIRILTSLDESFPRIRRGVVDRMMHEVFEADPPPMQYFRPGLQLTPEITGLPEFRHVRSITTAFAFLRFVYRGRLQEMVRTLSRILPVRQRDSSSDLVLHVAGIEEALADIEDFDDSFSPDSDDGKSYYRVRYAVEKDVSMQRSFRNLIQQRDRLAASIVDSASEHIEGLILVFDSIQRGLTDQVRERYAESDSRANAVDGLDRLLESGAASLGKYMRLIRQVRAMEEGY